MKKNTRTDRMWGASKKWVGNDGSGSLGQRAASAAAHLRRAIVRVGAKRVLDAGCGSCAWQLGAIPEGVSYMGVDVRKFDHWPEQCSVLDIVEGPLPEADLVIVRDVLIHLTNLEAARVIENVKAASRYLFTTTNGMTQQMPKGGWIRSVKASDFLDDAELIEEYENYFDIGNPRPRIIHHHQLWDLRPDGDE